MPINILNYIVQFSSLDASWRIKFDDISEKYALAGYLLELVKQDNSNEIPFHLMAVTKELLAKTMM